MNKLDNAMIPPTQTVTELPTMMTMESLSEDQWIRCDLSKPDDPISCACINACHISFDGLYYNISYKCPLCSETHIMLWYELKQTPTINQCRPSSCPLIGLCKKQDFVYKFQIYVTATLIERYGRIAMLSDQIDSAIADELEAL